MENVLYCKYKCHIHILQPIDLGKPRQAPRPVVHAGWSLRSLGWDPWIIPQQKMKECPPEKGPFQKDYSDYSLPTIIAEDMNNHF